MTTITPRPAETLPREVPGKTAVHASRCRASDGKYKPFRPTTALALLAAAVALSIAGCQRQEEIRTYTVEKFPESGTTDSATPTATNAGPAAQTDRIIGAIVPQGARTWFFKMSGPQEAVSEQMPPFLEFVGSLRFPDGEAGAPTWSLPEGWSEETGSGMRQATIHITNIDPALEMSVIQLPSDGGDPEGYLLANVNRWRGQLGLPPVAQSELFDSSRTEEVLKVPVDGGEATLVNLVGQLNSSPMSSAPFAGPFGGRPTPPATGGGASPASEELKYEVPEGWQSTPAGGMRRAAFTIERDGKSAEMTVIVLPGTAGGLLANVNRWRDQVGLPPVSEDELASSSHQLEVDGRTAHSVQLDGEAESILGVILQQPEQSWYFKLKGDNQLVSDERPAFDEFVRSVKFVSAGEN